MHLLSEKNEIYIFLHYLREINYKLLSLSPSHKLGFYNRNYIKLSSYINIGIYQRLQFFLPLNRSLIEKIKHFQHRFDVFFQMTPFKYEYFIHLYMESGISNHKY